MPKISKKTRKKRNLKEEDDTESESGKLSETQEVAKKLSRTRLGKENAAKNSTHPNSKPKGSTDPYDADSEVESDVNSQSDSKDSRIRSPMSPMIIETCSKESMASVPHPLKHKSLKLLCHDQSTPSTVTPGQSDDSLFGFASPMESPLPFSPVTLASPVHSESGSMFSVASSTGISPGKRKLQLRVFDVPVERPSKKIKKKKQSQNKQQPSQDMQDIMNDFQEVEMFSLAID